MGIKEIKKIGMCVICGIKPDKKNFNDGKDKLSENGMCKPCQNLADEKFYEIPNNLLVRKYFKDFLGKKPTKDEREDIDELFKQRPTTKWIHGIMPSRCPICKNLATNRGNIQSYKIGTPQHEKVIIKGITPSLVCKACGDHGLYLNHVYGFSREDTVKALKYLSAIKEANKESKKLVCETCAAECGFGEPKYTEEEKQFIKKTERKVLCKECIIRLKENVERTKSKIQANN